MNRHTKIALFIAPVLLIGGYGLMDLYLGEKAKNDVFELSQKGFCDVINGDCILSAGDLEANIFEKDDYTSVNTTLPLDKATLFLVDENNQATPYRMGMIESPYYWHAATNLKELAGQKGQGYKMRVILQYKGSQYIAEFQTQTAQ
ncbi:hypothetical protein [Thalassotalea agarivorans]|uniref:FixH protein n=1 Tax=Thalassotalea agarivorans TaxID=349064 RepID=A0A1I0CMW5_THASX|nr:hypothetical protein [Thalassotalea agarivorans]SET20339.1 hypothetical protein SAMN05660429_01239 [Thalassotalea agarivorans]